MTGESESQQTLGSSTICSLSRLVPRAVRSAAGAISQRERTVSYQRQERCAVCLDGVTATGSKAFHTMRKVVNDDE
jgi:hypothetical protein